MSTYDQFIARKRQEYGERFSPPPAAEHFGPYLGSRQRVRVRFAHGEELTGTIGVTTGWRPVFLLMRTSRAVGSMYTLGDQDRIVARQVGRVYRPL